MGGLTEPAQTRNFVITWPTQILELKAPSCSATTRRAQCHEGYRQARAGTAARSYAEFLHPVVNVIFEQQKRTERSGVFGGALRHKRPGELANRTQDKTVHSHDCGNQAPGGGW